MCEDCLAFSVKCYVCQQACDERRQDWWPPRGEPSLWRGIVVPTVLTPVNRSSDSLACHAVTRLDRVLPRAVCIVDSEVSFCFVMIMICNEIMMY